jgi:hypothetical protein
MIRLSLTVSFLISIVACVPVQPQAQPQPAAGQEETYASEGEASSPTSGPEHDAACRAACTVFDQCGKQPFDRCTRECEGMQTHKLERFAMYNCEQLTAVLTGTVGTQCMSYGKDDCLPLGHNYKCCGGNEATRTPGRCTDMAVCAMPRY